MAQAWERQTQEALSTIEHLKEMLGEGIDWQVCSSSIADLLMCQAYGQECCPEWEAVTAAHVHWDRQPWHSCKRCLCT